MVKSSFFMAFIYFDNFNVINQYRFKYPLLNLFNNFNIFNINIIYYTLNHYYNKNNIFYYILFFYKYKIFFNLDYLIAYELMLNYVIQNHFYFYKINNHIFMNNNYHFENIYNKILYRMCSCNYILFKQYLISFSIHYPYFIDFYC